jgi:hypothetical protein
MKDENQKCVICRESLKDNASIAHAAINWFSGHDPHPVATTGRACDKCHEKKVLPRRLFEATFRAQFGRPFNP